MPAFDHVIIFSKNPEQHEALFRSVHHLQGARGGEHIDWGTFNHLSYMENNSYIEWLGIADVTQAERSENPLIQHAVHADRHQLEGPIQFALRVTDIDAYVDRFEAKGISYKGPFPGKRTRTDGSVLKWRMLFPEYAVDEDPLPFLIEWNGEGNLPENPNEVNQVPFTEVILSVENPADYRKKLAEIYNLQPTSRAIFQLENGHLSVNQGNNLTAKFDTITFKRV